MATYTIDTSNAEEKALAYIVALANTQNTVKAALGL